MNFQNKVCACWDLNSWPLYCKTSAPLLSRHDYLLSKQKNTRGGEFCSSVPWILIHVKYFMKAGSWAKVMSKNDSIVNNYAWFCPYNIANWMQQTLTQRVLFLPILWMNWSMLMNFETHHTCIQICYIMKWIYHKWIRTRCI